MSRLERAMQKFVLHYAPPTAATPPISAGRTALG
jgi:hypothetical protein